MSKKIEDVKIEGNDRTGYTVSYYEWTEGQGRDCGLNRDGGKFETLADAKDYVRALKSA